MTGITTKAHRGALDDLANGEGRETPIEHVTGQPIGPSKIGMDVIPHGVHFVTQSVAAEAGSTSKKIVITAHSALRGDVIRILTTANAIEELEVTVDSVTANEIIFVGNLSADIATSDTVAILRNVQPLFSASGAAASGPLVFTRDGVDQEVIEDTVTPSNNVPLPVKLSSVTGDINITANDLNVQTSHTGANPDSVQIGNGTNLMAVNASLEAQVRDDDAITELTAIKTAVEIIDNAISGSEMQVDIVSGGPLGTEVTLDAIKTAVEIIDNAISGSEMQVDIVTSALPAGAATEATLAAASATLTGITGKLGSLGQKASAGSAPFVISTEQEAILTAIQTAVEIIDNAIAGTEMQVDIVDIAGISTEATLALQSAKLPASLGQKASAASLSVTLSNDEGDMPIGADDTVAFADLSFSSNNVTGAAYTQLIADIGAVAGKKVHIFSTSGNAMYLAIGAGAGEVDKVIVFPGGSPHQVQEVAIPANSRLSLKRVEAGTTDSGTILINVMG